MPVTISPAISSTELLRIKQVAIDTIREVQLDIRSQITEDPEDAFAELEIVKGAKPLLGVDYYAEKRAGILLRKHLKLDAKELLVLGEESLSIKEDANDLTAEKRLVVLLDMVDGTDLLERGLSNWCSAMVFFDPQGARGRKILAAFIGVQEDGVYYATRDKNEVRKHHFHVPKGRQRDVLLSIKRSYVEDLANATICFYGQQVADFVFLAKHGTFVRHLEELVNKHSRAGNPLKTRVYNLAGNPMMIKMVDGHRRIDAVFDASKEGQAPHDVVAGAYIACKGGAILRGIDTDANIDLEQGVLHPANANYKFRYVLASTSALAVDLCECLRT